MLWSNQNINRFFSGTLLIVLLFVHSVKLLHSHSFNHLYAAKSIKTALFDQATNNDESKFSTDCEICTYQIAKDTDDAVAFIDYSCKIDPISFYNDYVP